jgi:hypothetical protein
LITVVAETSSGVGINDLTIIRNLIVVMIIVTRRAMAGVPGALSRPLAVAVALGHVLRLALAAAATAPLAGVALLGRLGWCW